MGILFALLTSLLSCSVLGKMSTLSKQMALQLSYASYADAAICRTIPGLTKSQIELCFRQPDVMAQALFGVGQAIKECQHQFQNHRWNCSSLVTRVKNPYASPILQKGFRETAFAYAMTSAGVAISVAKACSQGSVTACGCDNQKYRLKGTQKSMTSTTTVWKWGGCSHNLRYGIKYSKLFLDDREKAGDIHSLINLHNNQVGRMAVTQNMQIKCKCHGLSGSCELKTCWRATPDYRYVGRILKEKYRIAVLVDQTNLNGNSRKFNVINKNEKKKKQKLKQYYPYRARMKKDLTQDLLYYQKSPNFCEKDGNLDVLGTTGRFCNRTSLGSESCSNLCCGRGYNLIRQKRTERCRCKFHWCCNVECQICIIEEWISVCK